MAIELNDSRIDVDSIVMRLLAIPYCDMLLESSEDGIDYYTGYDLECCRIQFFASHEAELVQVVHDVEPMRVVKRVSYADLPGLTFAKPH